MTTQPQPGRSRGRPLSHGSRGGTITIYLPPEQIEWLKRQSAGISPTIQQLIQERIDTMTAKITTDKLAEMCQAALDNWDWGNDENGMGERMQRHLRYYAERPQEWIKPGEIHEIGPSFKDEWDWLYEMVNGI